MTNTALVAPATNVTPFKFNDTDVRTIIVDGEVWFVAGDVAKALGYREAETMTRNLDADEKGPQNVWTLGGQQKLSAINESGLYHAVLKSRKPEAKQFRKWVTNEVLPQIRKTGSYGNRQEALPATVTQEELLLQIKEYSRPDLPKEITRAIEYTTMKMAIETKEVIEDYLYRLISYRCIDGYGQLYKNRALDLIKNASVESALLTKKMELLDTYKVFAKMIKESGQNLFDEVNQYN